jgi:hypothetical protein
MSISRANHEWTKVAEDRREQQERRGLPARWSGPRPYRTVLIGGGNTIDSQDGIKVSDDPITSIPTAYDPDSSPSCIDGVGWGTLYVDGVEQTTKVLVVNDNRSSFNCFLLAGDQVYAGDPIMLDVDGGDAVVAYVAG